MAKLRTALIALIALAMAAQSALALTINTTFVASGNLPVSTRAVGSAPGTVAGGGSLTDIVRAAADVWELALLDGGTVNIAFGWGPLTSPTIGQAVYYVPSPGDGDIIFDNVSTNWFMDATPLNSSEYGTFTESSQDLGGGDVNTGRHYTSPSGAASGRSDLFTTALHEIGHILGVNNNGSWANPFEILAPLPYAGTEIPTDGGHIDISTANMYPSSIVGTRTELSAVDILAAAQNAGYVSVDINPVPEPAAIYLALAGMAAVLVVGRARRRAKRKS